MSIAVTCLVGLLVLSSGKPQHLNVQLDGVEVRELSADRSLVDFSQAITRLHIPVLQSTAFPVNTNVCKYSTEQMAIFNKTDSELTAAERAAFEAFSARTVQTPSKQMPITQTNGKVERFLRRQ